MERINFKQERDLGATLKDVSTFIKQNFVSILKPMLIVVCIPLVLAAIMMINGMQDFYGGMGNVSDPLQVYSNMVALIPGYFLMMIAYVLGYIVVIAYIKLYANGQDNISLSDLLPTLKAKGFSLIISSIVLIIAMYAGMFLCVLPGFYLAIVFAQFFAISIIEDTGFGATWKRSFYLIKDNWWSTFGLYIVTYLISIAIMMILYIPLMIIMSMGMFSAVEQGDPDQMMNSMSTTMSYMMPFYYLVAIVISLLYAVVSSMRYYSLVEQHDGDSERDLIDQI